MSTDAADDTVWIHSAITLLIATAGLGLDAHLVFTSFSRYYTGEKEAPILTIIIGGNHEASNYLWEL